MKLCSQRWTISNLKKKYYNLNQFIEPTLPHQLICKRCTTRQLSQNLALALPMTSNDLTQKNSSEIWTEEDTSMTLRTYYPTDQTDKNIRSRKLKKGTNNNNNKTKSSRP